MPDYEVIDTHIHTYRSAEIARQAMTGASHGTSDGGTIDEFQRRMAELGIVAAAMVNFTPVIEMQAAARAKIPAAFGPDERAAAEAEIRLGLAGRIQRRNDWSLDTSRADRRLATFIGVDPSMMDAPDLEAELERCRGLGATGIKLHPVVQEFHIDDRRLWPVYAAAQRLGMSIIYHGGYFVAGAGGEFARPRRLAAVAGAFPRLLTVLAHCGVGFFEESIAIAERFPNVYFDCCAIINPDCTLVTLDDTEMVNLLRRLGTGRVFYGSDWPFYDPAADLERLRRLDLTGDERRAILSENARRVLGL